MTIEKVQRGRPFEVPLADDWNQLSDSVERFNDVANPTTLKNFPPFVFCSEAIPSNGVARYTRPVPLPATDETLFRTQRDAVVESPTEALDAIANLFQVSQSSVPSFGVGTLPDGVAKVRVDVTDVEHQYAWPKAGNYHELQSGGMGYRILWKDTQTTGVQWCVIRMSHFGLTIVGGLTDGVVPVGGSNTITVDNGTVPDGRTYTVHDFFGEEIGSGVRVVAWHLRPDKAYVLVAACEDPGGGGGPVFPT